MPGTTTPSAIKAQSQSQQQTTKPARRRRATSTTPPLAETHATPRLAVSILPPGHFVRIGGAELSPAERLLVESFRQLSDFGHRIILDVVQRAAEREREKRVKQNGGRLHLVKGGVQ